MGCGSSTPATAADRATSRRYLDYAGADFSGDGAPLYLPSTGPLTAKEYKERLTTSDGTRTVFLPESRYTIKYAYVSQRGYYPDSPDKMNQDAFCVHTYFGGGPEQHLFGVFDGHGEFGTPAAQFAREKVGARAPDRGGPGPLAQRCVLPRRRRGRRGNLSPPATPQQLPRRPLTHRLTTAAAGPEQSAGQRPLCRQPGPGDAQLHGNHKHPVPPG
jgi:hypothetical protein